MLIVERAATRSWSSYVAAVPSTSAGEVVGSAADATDEEDDDAGRVAMEVEEGEAGRSCCAETIAAVAASRTVPQHSALVLDANATFQGLDRGRNRYLDASMITDGCLGHVGSDEQPQSLRNHSRDRCASRCQVQAAVMMVSIIDAIGLLTLIDSTRPRSSHIRFPHSIGTGVNQHQAHPHKKGKIPRLRKSGFLSRLSLPFSDVSAVRSPRYTAACWKLEPKRLASRTSFRGHPSIISTCYNRLQYGSHSTESPMARSWIKGKSNAQGDASNFLHLEI